MLMYLKKNYQEDFGILAEYRLKINKSEKIDKYVVRSEWPVTCYRKTVFRLRVWSNWFNATCLRNSNNVNYVAEKSEENEKEIFM